MRERAKNQRENDRGLSGVKNGKLEVDGRENRKRFVVVVRRSQWDSVFLYFARRRRPRAERDRDAQQQHDDDIDDTTLGRGEPRSIGARSRSTTTT